MTVIRLTNGGLVVRSYTGPFFPSQRISNRPAGTGGSKLEFSAPSQLDLAAQKYLADGVAFFGKDI